MAEFVPAKDQFLTAYQLFQWILYGKVNFNKTTTPGRLYNLKRGANLTRESKMHVWGEITFEHEGVQYLVRREWEYYKILSALGF